MNPAGFWRLIAKGNLKKTAGVRLSAATLQDNVRKMKSAEKYTVEMDRTTALIALGGNLPGPGRTVAQTLVAALAALVREGFGIVAVSRFHRSPAYPAGSGPDYVNACARLQTADLTPAEVLAALHRVEVAFGRNRSTRWAARGLDLDLLAMGDTIAPDAATLAQWIALPPTDQARLAPETLILPHPRLAERAFVLIPLFEIAPRWRHPMLGQSVAEMLAALPAAEKAALSPICAPANGDSMLVKGNTSA